MVVNIRTVGGSGGVYRRRTRRDTCLKIVLVSRRRRKAVERRVRLSRMRRC